MACALVAWSDEWPGGRHRFAAIGEHRVTAVVREHLRLSGQPRVDATRRVRAGVRGPRAVRAYKIADLGAAGGFMISPLGLQVGAEKVAQAENVISVILDSSSNATEYFMEALHTTFIGLTDSGTATDSVHVRDIPASE